MSYRLFFVESLSQCIGITGQFWICGLQSLCECCGILVGSKQFLHLLQIGNLELHLSLLCQTTVTADEVLGSRGKGFLGLGQFCVNSGNVANLQRTDTLKK